MRVCAGKREGWGCWIDRKRETVTSDLTYDVTPNDAVMMNTTAIVKY